jgi:endoglucanase
MAQASRIWGGLKKKAEAKQFLNRAKQAYRWAIQHPPRKDAPPQEVSAYRSETAYAAAELLRTTHDRQYEVDFEKAAVWTQNPNAELEVYQQYDQSRAAWAYSRCPITVVKPALQKAVKRAILRYADRFIAVSSTMSYGFLRHPESPITWGTGAQLHWAVPATWAYYLTENDKYRYWIVRSCDNTLGANPLGLSYIAGLGTRTARAPLHNSRYSHLGEVMDGMQVNGPFEQGEGYNVKETAYPKIRPDFANLYTFVDAHFAIGMDEGLSRTQSEAMSVFGFLLHPRKTRANSR